MIGRIVPLKKQLCDKFSLLSREELLTLLSGTCILSPPAILLQQYFDEIMA